MTKLAKIERDIAALSPFEFARLRVWFEHCNADALYRRIKRDAATGRLDALDDTVLADHHAGKTRPLSLTLRRWLSGDPTRRSRRPCTVWPTATSKFPNDGENLK